MGEEFARRGTSAASQLRNPRRAYPFRLAESGVREPIKRSRRYCGVTMATYEETNPDRTTNLHAALFWQSRHGWFSAGVDLGGGGRTDHGEQSGPRAGSAVSPCLFLRRSRPAKQRENEPARNFWTQRRFARLSSDIYAAVFPHSGGTETEGDEIVGRRRYFGGVSSVCAPAELTWMAEKEPIMADQFGCAPRWQCHLGYFSAGVDCAFGELPNF